MTMKTSNIALRRKSLKCETLKNNSPKKRFKEHRLVHSEEKPFKCETCN